MSAISRHCTILQQDSAALRAASRRLREEAQALLQRAGELRVIHARVAAQAERVAVRSR